MNLNKVIIIGRLTGDPELRSTNSGNSVANFSMATNRNWTDSKGEKQEEAQFHNVIAWGRKAEVASKFLSKGDLAMIEGRLQTRKWEDKNGNNRYTTEIVADVIQFGPKNENSDNSEYPKVRDKVDDTSGETDGEIKLEDIKF